jgi:hypothetical protein
MESDDFKMKIEAVFVEGGPSVIYVDEIFIENFLLGTLGIYPKGGNIYSFLFKSSFY